MIDNESLFKISYGLYIVCSGDKNKGNGFVSNTVMQVSSEPPLFAICCNKNNFTAELIREKGSFSVSVLEQDCSSELIGTFGYRSGSDMDKMENRNIRYGLTGVPILLNECISFLECKCIRTVDTGTHLMFIGEVLQAEMLNSSKVPLTYAYYREVRKGISPKNAPTYVDQNVDTVKTGTPNLKKYQCLICGYIFEETEDLKFEDLPDDWTCPVCGVDKSEFIEI